MRDEHAGALDAGQVAFEPLPRLDVQVIRGLVDQQEVGWTEKEPRELGPRPLATGKLPHFERPFARIEDQTIEHARGPRLEQVTAGGLVGRQQVGVAQGGRLVVEAGFKGSPLAPQAPEPRVRVEDELFEELSGRCAHLLPDVREAQA